MSASRELVLITPGTIISGAGGPGAGTPVPALSMLQVIVKITGVTGSGSPALRLWLVSSADGGSNWADHPYDKRLVSATGAVDVIAYEGKRNIVDGEGATGTHIAIYQTLPADIIGLQYETVGSFTAGQGFTLGAWAVGK